MKKLLLLIPALLHSQDTSWLTYGLNHAGWRYAELDQINNGNVSRLVPKWIFQTGINGKFETTPIVRDGMMYLTAPSNHAFAVDLLSGRPIWHYAKPIPKSVNLCCGQVNRGFAIRGGVLYKVNLESTLVAIDEKTGQQLWESQIEDVTLGYSATVAPLIVKDMVIVGIAGAEFGSRDFIDAYDAETGKRRWRFWTVPSPGEPGSESWTGDSWKRGGGSTWITGTYDPELNLIYWGTGNPGPDLDGSVRPGDNLYTCSLLALDADTGKRKWHFQFTPHDVHDWDSTSDPVLIDIEHRGAKRKAVVMANRNGFYYALDRADGKLLAVKSYTKTTWADSIDPETGRPNLVTGQDPTEEGNKSCPGMGGGHNWQATTYSPKSGLYYFTSTDGCAIYFKYAQDYVEGLWYQASTVGTIPTEPAKGSIIAVKPATGDIAWKYPLVSPPSTGLLATSGGLIFGGDREGYIFALDANSGKVLWKFQTGGTVIAPPVSYRFRGKQYVAIAAGSAMIAFALAE